MGAAQAAQVKDLARARPRSRRSPARASASRTPAAIDSGAVRVEEHRGVAADLGERAGARRRDRAARRHRLERWQAEALVEAGEDEGSGAAVELAQLAAPDEPAHLHACRHRPEAVERSAGEHQPERGVLGAQQREASNSPAWFLWGQPRAGYRSRFSRGPRFGSNSLASTPSGATTIRSGSIPRAATILDFANSLIVTTTSARRAAAS